MLAMKILLIFLCLTHTMLACGQTDTQQKNSPSVPRASTEPPACDCCVFDEIKGVEGHQVKIAADTATGQRIVIRGIIYQSDGKTPAPNVLLYFYQTDHTGRYSK